MSHALQHMLSPLLSGAFDRVEGTVSLRSKALARQRNRVALQAALAVVCTTLAVSAHGQVYVGADPSAGAIVLSNFPSPQAHELLLPAVREPVVEGAVRSETGLLRSVVKPPIRAAQLRDVIERVARTVDIAPSLIHAVISAESNYDAQAVSPKGAIGLMQLMPATARRFGVRDAFVVQDNVLAGASYLKWLMGYFKGDIELVLAAYNAGEQAVVRAGHKVPRYPETQAYVRRIMAELRSTDSLPL